MVRFSVSANDWESCLVLANERDVHVHQKVVAPFVIERVVAVHEVDDDAGARAPCLRGGLDARGIAKAVVGRESP